MAINPDYRDLFAALNATEARYLLVGGYALAVHSVPRFTKDLDVWVEASDANSARVMRALDLFGAPLLDLTEADLARPGLVYQIGVAPNRVDVVTGIDGVDFQEAWSKRITTSYGDQTVPVIGRTHLIQNKRASARPQDLLDLEALERDS